MSSNQKSDGKKRDSKGRFLKGHEGGPGRRKGEPCTVARVLRGHFQDKVDEIASIILDRALKGDLEACRLILERLYPKPKDNPIEIELPEKATMAEITKRIVGAVALGQLTPLEGQALGGVVANHMKALEVTELNNRLRAIEEAIKIQKEK